MTGVGRGPGQGGGEHGRGNSSAAVRGAVLVGIAVILAIVLLNVVDDGTTGPIGDSDAGDTSTTTVPAAGVTTTTAGAMPATVPPAQIRVRVYNASAPPGAAATKTDELRAAGYQTLSAADTDPRENTVAYCAPDFAADAEPLAAAVGGGAIVDNALDPLPAGSEEADCIVILGPQDTTTESTAAG